MAIKEYKPGAAFPGTISRTPDVKNMLAKQ
jgi:hypothetical protein